MFSDFFSAREVYFLYTRECTLFYVNAFANDRKEKRLLIWDSVCLAEFQTLRLVPFVIKNRSVDFMVTIIVPTDISRTIPRIVFK